MCDWKTKCVMGYGLYQFPEEPATCSKAEVLPCSRREANGWVDQWPIITGLTKPRWLIYGGENPRCDTQLESCPVVMCCGDLYGLRQWVTSAKKDGVFIMGSNMVVWELSWVGKNPASDLSHSALNLWAILPVPGCWFNKEYLSGKVMGWSVATALRHRDRSGT